MATHNLHPCCRVMQQNQEYLPKVLAVFLGDCGMGHPDEACTALTFITALQRHHEITFCSITTLSLTVYVLHGSDWSSLSESVFLGWAAYAEHVLHCLCIDDVGKKRKGKRNQERST